MTITAEECGELTQRCSKMMRKFNTVEEATSEQLKLLTEEAGDVMCMIELMIENGLMTTEQIRDRINAKRDKLKIWSDLIVENNLENLG